MESQYKWRSEKKEVFFFQLIKMILQLILITVGLYRPTVT